MVEPSKEPTSFQSSHLNQKLGKILDLRLESDKETLEALRSLSTIFVENNIRTRRNLRSDIEKKNLAVNEEFVQAFREVKEVLDKMCGDIHTMSNHCKDMTDRLQKTKAQTHDLISQTTKLKTECQTVQLKQDIISAFLQTFQLSPEEVKCLRGSRDGKLEEGFFAALTRVKKIHEKCKVLLRSNQQTAGIEIMESMALHQEAAFERLYRWTQGECRMLNVENPDMNAMLWQAMENLQDRPVLFKYSVDEYSTARRAAVVRGFIDALTRGGPGGTPRPIELHSHDPLRYTGDMLAWLHQTTASEKEMLEALLRNCNKDRLEDDIKQALSHITEGLCRPLKVRVEQLIVSEPGAVILFRLSSLLKFYHHTINQVMQISSQLLTTLEELHLLAQKMFFNSLTCHCNRLIEQAELPPAGLGPTEAVLQTLSLMREVLSCQDACLVSMNDRQQDVPQILQATVEPLLQLCHMTASKLATADMAVYMANCIYQMHSTLALFEFVDQWLEMLQAQMDAHLDTLVSEQASHIVSNLAMGAVYKILQDYQPKQGPLINLPGCDSLAIQAIGNKLDTFLGSPDTLIIAQSQLILSASMRQALRKRSIEIVCDFYSQLYQAAHLTSNHYPEPNSLLPRSPEQVRSLLV